MQITPTIAASQARNGKSHANKNIRCRFWRVGAISVLRRDRCLGDLESGPWVAWKDVASRTPKLPGISVLATIQGLLLRLCSAIESENDICAVAPAPLAQRVVASAQAVHCPCSGRLVHALRRGASSCFVPVLHGAHSYGGCGACEIVKSRAHPPVRYPLHVSCMARHSRPHKTF